MTRARLVAAAAALLAALLLARALTPEPSPVTTLALPAPGATALPASPTASPAPAMPPPPAEPAVPDLRAFRNVLARLDAARTAAFADPAAATPDAWADTGCSCHAADAVRLRALARDGTSLRGHRVTVDSVAFASPPSATRVDLAVVDRLAAYALTDRSGRVVSRWAATGPRRWRVRLVLVRERWLVGEVVRAP